MTNDLKLTILAATMVDIARSNVQGTTVRTRTAARELARVTLVAVDLDWIFPKPPNPAASTASADRVEELT